MRKFILLAIFSIGMFAMLPSMSSASGSPPDQVCFVADSHQAVQAYDVQEINVKTFFAFELQAIKQPVCTAENVVQKTPDFNKFYLLNYRTCLNTKDVSNQRKFLTKNKVSYDQIRIRDDTSV